jgi:hypothetical protein
LLYRFGFRHDVPDDGFPAWRVEVLHHGDDIVAERNRTVKVAKEYWRTRKTGC